MYIFLYIYICGLGGDGEHIYIYIYTHTVHIYSTHFSLKFCHSPSSIFLRQDWRESLELSALGVSASLLLLVLLVASFPCRGDPAR